MPTPAETPTDFDGYRREYFQNPQARIDPRYVDAAQFLITNLLGLPQAGIETTSPESQDTPFAQFVNELAARMQDSRHFDHVSMAQLHPNGFMPGVLANMASTARNNNTIFQGVSPAETLMEREAVRWLAEEIAGYDTDTSSGVITTGGTLANLTALTAARERLSSKRTHGDKGRRVWDGKSTAYILASEAAHYSIAKAAAILAPNAGIQVLKIPLEEGGFRMDTEQLERYVQKLKKRGKPIMAIVGVAGETETGLVDDLDKMADIATQHDVFFHVDGAYGAPFRLTRQADLFEGMERADSLTVDPHKYMYAPYPAGSILFRDRNDHDRIATMNDGGSAYVFQDDAAKLNALAGAAQGPIEPPVFLGRSRIEGSMGGQGASATWAVIHTLGREGLKAVLEHTMDVADHVYERVKASDVFAPIFKPDLNSLCFYPDPTLAGNTEISNLLTYQGYEDGQNTDENPKYQILQNLLIEEARQRLEDRTSIYVTTTDLSVPIASKGFGKTEMDGKLKRREDRKARIGKAGVVRRLERHNPREERKYMKVYRLVPTHPYTEDQHVDLAIDNLETIWRELIHEVLSDTLPLDREGNITPLQKFVTQAKETRVLELAQKTRRNPWWTRQAAA